MTTPDLPAVRVLTLNLNFDPESLDQRLPAAAHDIAAAAPDVVCLQEVAPLSDGTDAAEALAQMVGMSVVARADHLPHPISGVHSVVILSTLPTTADAAVLELPQDLHHTRRVTAVPLRAPSGRRVLVVTAHLAWGGDREPARVAEAVLVDEWATHLASSLLDERHDFVVFTGDFNARPDSDTLRFLTGRSGVAGRGTYWVDAWETVGEGDGHTQVPANPWVARTARLVGIPRPDMLPSRRIDYVMVRGWAHGRPGSPLAAQVVATEPAGPHHVVASDHYGLLVDLWDPALS